MQNTWYENSLKLVSLNASKCSRAGVIVYWKSCSVAANEKQMSVNRKWITWDLRSVLIKICIRHELLQFYSVPIEQPENIKCVYLFVHIFVSLSQFSDGLSTLSYHHHHHHVWTRPHTRLSPSSSSLRTSSQSDEPRPLRCPRCQLQLGHIWRPRVGVFCGTGTERISSSDWWGVSVDCPYVFCAKNSNLKHKNKRQKIMTGKTMQQLFWLTHDWQPHDKPSFTSCSFQLKSNEERAAHRQIIHFQKALWH